MNRLIVLTICLLAMSAQAQNTKPATQQSGTIKPQPALNAAQKTSYGFGVLVASNLKAQAGDSLDLDAFFKGIKDAYQGKTLQLPMEECSGLVQNHVQSFGRRKLDKIKKTGEEFLAKNKLDPAIKTTTSGLQYKVITAGTGATPTINDRVTVHYTGKLIDGTIFDSSVQRGQPATFGLTQVVSGWTEVLQLMKEGDKWMVYIPQELGYGANGKGAQIPPYTMMIFELELIKVN